MDIKEVITQFGLSSRESDVYLTCLEMGMSPIMPLVKKTGIPRSSLVYILENLREKHLIEVVTKRSRRLYLPHQPRVVLRALKNELEKAKSRVENFEEVLPDLNRLFRTTLFQPNIKLFRGTEIRECYAELLQESADEIWNVGETDKILEVLGTRFWQSWTKQRAKRGIKAKAIRIGTSSASTEKLFTGKATLRTVRYAPEGFVCPAHILICGNTVVIITTAKESFGVLITSRDYAMSMKSWFKELWNISK